jgi:branched-chain amino acid transport system ATP-binding protein
MLSALDIEVKFGAMRAVDGVTVELAGDHIVGLAGPNGSGKTSLLNALTGVVPAGGKVTIDGKAVRLGRPQSARKAGLLRTYQTPQVYSNLSCVENVMLSTATRGWTGLTASLLVRPAMRNGERARWHHAAGVLDRLGLRELIAKPAAGLSYGDQRMLELARAVAGEPKVLLLDEPSAGLNEQETTRVGEILTELRHSELAILIVDHKIDFLSALCDRITVLAQGALIADGAPDDVWANQLVIDAYLGVEGA